MKEQGSLRNNGFCRTLLTSGVLGNAAKALSIVLLAAAFVYAVPSASWGISGDNNSARVQCDDLLQRARQALSEGKLDVAEALIQNAESLDVKYDRLFPGDTPSRLRVELNKARQSNAQSQDPFAVRKSVPETPSTAPSVAPVSDAQAANTPMSPAALAKQYLLQGRKSLNQGNLAQAGAFCGEAMKLKVAYAPGEDTPEKLHKDIQTASNVMNGMAATKAPVNGPVASAAPTAPGVPASPVTAAVAPTAPANAASVAMTQQNAPENTPAKDVPVQVRRQSDKLLLDARLALATGDVAKAQSAVAQARGLNVPYGPKNDSPVKVSMDIQAYQNAANAMKQSQSENNRKEFARVLISQADTLYFLRQYNIAEELAVNAQRLNAQYTSYDRRPEDVLEKINTAREKMAKADMTNGVRQAAHNQKGPNNVNTAEYKPAQDNTYVRQVSAIQPGQPGAVNASEVSPGIAMQYFAQGEAALKAGNVAAARQAFTEAAKYKDQLDPLTQRRLNDQLTLLPNADAMTTAPIAPADQDLVGEVTAEQQALYGKVITELVEQEGKAKQLKNTQPQEAVKLLNESRENIEKSDLTDAYKTRLLARVDNLINEINAYAVQNGAVIATEERNREILAENNRQVQLKNEKEQKIAQLLDEYNELIRQQRFAEAEIKAKQAFEIDPNDRVCIQVMEIAKTQRRLAEGLRIRTQKEQGFLTSLQNVDESAIPFDDNNPMQFPNVKTWEELTKRRAQETDKGPYTERELQIISKLDTPVRLDFRQTPISTVLEELANLTGVNIHLDPNGLAAAGVSSDTPITIALKDDVSLKSALNLILRSHDLTYVVKDEVLQITSTSMGRGQVYTKSYSVADLVIPIPNFVPSANMGLAGAYSNALQALGYNGGSNLNNAIMAPATAVATRDAAKMDNPALMAQMDSGSSGSMSNPMVPSSGAQGSLGSGSGADFDSLIELITNTVNPDSWKDNGGEGTISPFETNLSLVVSQTQEVHDKIVELLEQLRRLQDLQVTIEVRFISLSDQFYERMGVDFNFNIKSDSDGIVEITSKNDPNTGEAIQSTSYKNSATVGLSAPGVLSANMDIPVTQNNYESVIPQFGGFTAGYGTSIGMAFLSDIEAYLFINAAQGDTRSNILQAPKVTLFNGQQAMVSDTQQSPFVISVTPVVGDFAAAQQPVICVLSEGTFLTVQAVVSNDRRFVRLTVVPFFSEIKEVNTFKFTGTESTTTDTSTEGDAEQPTTNKKSDSTSTTSSGTSVQLPTFAYQTVTTTVSVPDGGTVLLGGIKRLKEGRNEQGTPILNKIPYINRLFKNVAIGRETESLMMMVTPRIIIQEEEEERLGVVAQ